MGGKLRVLGISGYHCRLFPRINPSHTTLLRQSWHSTLQIKHSQMSNGQLYLWKKDPPRDALYRQY